jgi:hypothetical protein
MDDDAANILKLISGTTGIDKTNDTGLAGTSIFEEDVEQHRNAIETVLRPNDNSGAADNVFVMIEAAQ